MSTTKIASKPTLENDVAELLAQMTSAEKHAQMAQVETHSITPDDVRAYGIGSVLSGGGGNPTPNTPAAWRAMVWAFLKAARTSRLGIPLLYGVDAVHGHNNVYGATIFPHNIGLGASRDADLVERIGRITAVEMASTGVRWNFAPAVSVARDIRWGRTYESYSQDPAIVAELGIAYMRGLRGDGDHEGSSTTVLESLKHFAGDGGTRWDSSGQYPWIPGWWERRGDAWHIDQGACDVDEQTFRSIHLAPYVAAVKSGARNIMVSYSSWNGVKMHANRDLLTEVLKGELGFTGFLVSDWLAVDQLSADYYKAVVMAVNAGLDMVMVPYDYQRFLDVMDRAVQSGDIAQARVDDAVSRIIRVKLEMGLFDQPVEDAPALSVMGSVPHRALAREAARKSAVLLKDDASVLPLNATLPHILVAGQGADDVGMQCGGWTIEWQGKMGNITPGATLLDGLCTGVSAETTIQYAAHGDFSADVQAPVAIVVVGEQPYAEGEGDTSYPRLSAADHDLIARVRPHCDRLIVILLSGRPLIVTDILDIVDVFIAAWWPGSEADGIADLLLGHAPFTGKLPFAWPRDLSQIPFNAADEPLWPVGYGIGS